MSQLKSCFSAGQVRSKKTVHFAATDSARKDDRSLGRRERSSTPTYSDYQEAMLSTPDSRWFTRHTDSLVFAYRPRALGRPPQNDTRPRDQTWNPKRPSERAPAKHQVTFPRRRQDTRISRENSRSDRDLEEPGHLNRRRHQDEKRTLCHVHDRPTSLKASHGSQRHSRSKSLRSDREDTIYNPS